MNRQFLSFSMVLLTSSLVHGLVIPGFAFTDISVEEGEVATVTLNSGLSTPITSCTVQTADNTAISGTDYTQFSTPLQIIGGSTITVDIATIDNVICQQDRTFIVTLNCNTHLSIENSEMTVTISDDDVSACNDPHLAQNVQWRDENGDQIIEKLCYDLYGQAGDRFQLITDQILDSSVVFELRDDYYIGKIYFRSPLGLVTITTTSLHFPSQELHSWNDTFTTAYKNSSVGNLFVEIKHRMVKVNLENGDRTLSVTIVKIEQKYGKSYLNIMINKITSKNGIFDENHGGLMGYISKREYKFYTSVQRDESVRVVKVDGVLTKSFSSRDSSSTIKKGCNYMKMKDLLYPLTETEFKES